MMDKEFTGLIDQCVNSLSLKDVQVLIDFLNRLREESLSEDELELLGKLLKIKEPLKLPNNDRARQFLLRGVIESVRGKQAATERGMARPKREFMEGIFEEMMAQDIIDDWEDASRLGRYDYCVNIQGKRIYIEAKGGFDGNSTRISDFPPDADETWKWFMVEGSPKNSPSSQVKKNRLLGDMVSKQKAETGFMVLDYLCGDPEIRPCPKPSEARIEILDELKSPFPDVFLLPMPPWSKGRMAWASNTKKPSIWLEALMRLWGIDSTEFQFHVHLIGIEIHKKQNKFRWGIRKIDIQEPWHLSQFRTVR